MRRRDFLGAVGGAAVAWPLAARAQKVIPLIGFLNPTSPEGLAHRLTAFRQGLSQTGFVEGQNVVIEYRWAEGQYNRLPELAADLVRRQVAVIFAAPSSSAILAAKAAAMATPIVFAGGIDPVKAGLVDSYNRPGGNITGVSLITVELAAKRLELLRSMVPKAAQIAVLVNSENPVTEASTRDVQSAARTLGLQLHFQPASNERDLETAFAAFAQKRVEALFIAADAFFTSQRDRITALAARHALPASYAVREFADAGGLLSYGPNFAEAYRLAGIYVGRILKGETPANLPVEQPTKFELVINLKTAKALGLTVPPTLLAIADEVIE
jgi:putative ABC transport system substrate-binding protein